MTAFLAGLNIVVGLALVAIFLQGGNLMAAQDDLAAAVTRLQGSADKIIAALASADATPAITAATTAINAVSDKLDAASAPPAPPTT